MLALILTILAATIVLWLLRHRVIRELGGTYVSIAGMFKRPNPNATWQDAYAPHCKACGYDLRASPQRCSECGEPVPAYERTIIHYLIKIGDGPPKPR